MATIQKYGNFIFISPANHKNKNKSSHDENAIEVQDVKKSRKFENLQNAPLICD